MDDMNNQITPEGEPDHEGAMAKADLYKLANYSVKLFKKLQDEDQLESWVQAKITKAADYIASVYHYIEYEMKFSEFGSKLENSEMYSESEKYVLKKKLMEAKDKIKELKKVQADKLTNPSKKMCKIKEGWDDFEDEDPDVKSADDELKKQKVKLPKVKVDADKDFEKLSSKKPCKSKKDSEKCSDSEKKDSEKKVDESKSKKPSAGLSKAKKSAVVKKAKSGGDIGKPGKGFAKVEKAAKKGGAKDPKAVAAAAMWKNIKRESLKENYGTFEDHVSDEENDLISAPPMSDEENDVMAPPDQYRAPSTSSDEKTADVETIKQIQKTLKDAGYPVDVDGIWGPESQKAYVDYSQRTAPQPMNESCELDRIKMLSGI